MKEVDILIVGGGAAGMTAGIYAARAGMRSVILEGGFVGGQASTTDHIENYPGFPQGVGGVELMMAFEQQYSRFEGAEVCYDGAASIDAAAKTAVTLSGETYRGKAMILCMGAEPRKLGVPGEDELRGQGVSYCATCDGMFYRGKTVAVVGGGDTAVEDAVYLKQMASVKLIHRRDQLRASSRKGMELMQDDSVEKHLNCTVQRIEKQGEQLKLALLDRVTGAEKDVVVDGVFIAVGTQPRTELVLGQLETDGIGYIMAGEDTRTSVSGVFAAGDVRTTPLRQVITAAADGAVAATMAVRYILEEDKKA